jgi:PAS domain S-box-containing protein
VALALLTGRRLLRPIALIARQAEAVAAGRGAAAAPDAGAASSVREFEALRQAVAAAQAELARQAEAERAAARRLGEREALLSAIGQSSPDLIFAKDAEGRMIYANPPTLALIGRPAEQVLSRTDLDFLADPAQAREVMANDRRILARGIPERVEERVADAARRGETRIFLSTKAPLRDAEGRAVGLVGVARDVTEERAMQSAMAEAAARFRAMVQVSPQVVWTADALGRVTFASDAWWEVTGQDPLAVLGTDRWLEALHPEDARPMAAAWRAAQLEARAEGPGRFEAEFRLRRAADGAWRWFVSRGVPERDAAGAVHRWIGAAFDIHDRREAEAALRASEARWRSLFDRMHEGFALCELVRDAAGRAVDFRYIEVNPAFERLTGLPPAHVLGRLASQALPGLEPFWIDTFARVVEAGEPAHVEHALAALGRWYECLAYRVEGERFAQLFFDVTARKAAEERQHLLAREVDHRAKNTLAVVQSVVGLTRAEDPASFRSAVTGRIAAMARAHTLLAREGWEGAGLRELAAEELAPHLGAADGAPARVTLRGPPVEIAAEATQPLGMALHELATNAVKHGALSVAEGRVELSWLPDPATGGLVLRWTERGGPPLEGPPARRGFGSSVVERTVTRQLHGEVTMAWDPAGLRCEIRLPPAQLRRAARRPEPATA